MMSRPVSSVARPIRCSSSERVIKVIESALIRGDGKETMQRVVTQYHDLDGRFLAEFDPAYAWQK